MTVFVQVTETVVVVKVVVRTRVVRVFVGVAAVIVWKTTVFPLTTVTGNGVLRIGWLVWGRRESGRGGGIWHVHCCGRRGGCWIGIVSFLPLYPVLLSDLPLPRGC